jgi:uncharacterized protein YacL
MVCSISCSLSTIFIIGMIYFYNATDKSEVVKNYKSKLSPELREKYNKITKERMMISYKGYGLGFLLSLIIIFYNRYKNPKPKPWDIFSLICIVISTSFLTNYFYYILSPKSDMMLNYLKNKEDIDNWHKVYREMQYNYHFGIALGIVAVGIMAFAFRC